MSTASGTVATVAAMPLTTVRAARRENLELLIQQHGGIPTLSHKTGISEKYLRQIKNNFQGPRDRKPRDLGDVAARRIESTLGLPEGWMDTPRKTASSEGLNSQAGSTGLPQGGPVFVDVGHPVSPETAHNVISVSSRMTIPVVGRAAFINGGTVLMEQERAAGFVPVPPQSESAYAIRQVGDDLDPFCRHGDFVVIDPTAPIYPGDDVLVTLADGTAAVMRLRYRKDGRTYLDPLIPGRPGLPALPDTEITAIHYVSGTAKSRTWIPAA